MSIRDRFLLFPMVVGICLGAVLGGCEDPAARQRAETQAAITEAGRKIEQATMVRFDPTDPKFTGQQQTLRQIVTELDGIREGEPGQLAAKHMLAATALQELADMSLGQAEEMEARHRIERGILLSRVRAALEIEAIARAMGEIEVSSQARKLDEVQAAARRNLDQLAQQMATLDGPISERTAQNNRDAQEAARLNEQANELRRESADAGYAAGFASFERAIALERQADQIEQEISHRTIDLDYNYQPQHALAKAHADFQQTLMRAARASQSDLQSLSELTSQASAQARQAMGELIQSIKSLNTRLNDEAVGPLSDFYATAENNLTKAATQARNAGSQARQAGGGGSNFDAKVLEAKVNATMGRMYRDFARTAAERGLLLDEFARTGGLLGDEQSFRTQRDAAGREFEDAITKAKDAYENAKSTLASVSAGDIREELDAFRMSIDSSLALLEGGLGPQALGQPDEPRGRTPRRSPIKGAESPEALAELVMVVDEGKPADILGLLDVLIPLDAVTGMDPAERQGVRILLDLGGRLLRLETALQDKFGQGLETLAQGMAGDGGMGGMMPMGLPEGQEMPELTSVKVQNLREDTGELLMLSSDGSEMTLPITRLGKRWYLGSKENFLADLMGEAMGAGGMGGPGMGAGGDEMGMGMEADPAMMIAMASGIAGMVGPKIDELTHQVQAGRFKSIDDFAQHVQTLVENMMGDMFGGMGGMDGMGGDFDFEEPEK